MKKLILMYLFVTLLFSLSCKEKLPLDKDLTKKNYTLINQDSIEVIFPKNIIGHITVMGFIYTHCPDICPMTTHNMYLTEKKLNESGIEDVKFIALSFDPDRDSPEVLRKFAEIRDLDFINWTLLTGEKTIVNELMKRFDVKAIKTDENIDEEGNSEYSMMHTDRISLIDEKGILRKNYKGSTINIEKIVSDIKTLRD